MSKTKQDEGVIQVLLERLNKQRLPRLLALKEQVDRNELLSDVDLDYLSEALEDANNIMPLIKRNPEYSSLATHIINLYHHIADKALENEKENSTPG